MIGKLVAGALIGFLLLSILGKWILVVIGIAVTLWLIRVVADIFWYFNDRGKVQ